MQLVDIGANLTHAAFRDDLDAGRSRARSKPAWRNRRHRHHRRGIPQAAALADSHPGLCSPPRASIRTTRANATRTRFRRCGGRSRSTRASSRSANAAWTSTATTRRIPTRKSGSSRSSSSAWSCGSRCSCIRGTRFRAFAEILKNTGVQKSGGALLHRRARRTACLPRPRPLHRHHRLDLRRAPRQAPARAGARHPARPADAGNRRALPHAARPEAAAEGAAQRARVPAAHPAKPSRAPSAVPPRRSPRRPRATRRRFFGLHESGASAAAQRPLAA